MVKLLSQRIKRQLGITMHHFCKNHLNTDYRTFQYRMRSNRYYPAEVIYICWLLDDTCENLFGQSFAELVLLDGPDNAVTFVRDKFTKASKKEKQRLMELIGFQVTPDAMTASVKFIETDKPISEPITYKASPKYIDKLIPDTPKEEEPESTEGEFEFRMVDMDLTNDNDEHRYGR